VLVILGGLMLVVSGCTTTRYLDEYSRSNETREPVKAAAVTAPAEKPPATESPSAARLRARLHAAIVDVEESPDIDSAVDAYAAGLSVDPNNLALHKAYLRRVIELDVPQLGVTATQHILEREPNNGLARALAAFIEARQGQMDDALTDITLAARKSPDEPFVQRTAGHLLAWYDHNPDPPYLPANVRRSLQNAHDWLAKTEAYDRAYADASVYYREQRNLAARQGPTTLPAGGGAGAGGDAVATTEPQQPQQPDYPDYAGYTGGGIGYSAAPTYAPAYEPYAVYNQYTYYEAPCYYPAYYGGWWWGPSFIVIDRFHHHDHDHDHDGHHDGDHHHDADDHFRHHYFGSGNNGGDLADGRHHRNGGGGANIGSIPTAGRHGGSGSGSIGSALGSESIDFPRHGGGAGRMSAIGGNTIGSATGSVFNRPNSATGNGSGVVTFPRFRGGGGAGFSGGGGGGGPVIIPGVGSVMPGPAPSAPAAPRGGNGNGGGQSGGMRTGNAANAGGGGTGGGGGGGGGGGRR
jgi:hypothetical protein